MKLLKGLLRLLNIGLVASTLLALFAPYIDPTWVWPVAFLGLAVPFLLLLNALAFAVFWRMRERSAAYQNAAILLLSMLLLGRLVGVTGQAQARHDFSILTFNTQLLADHQKSQTAYEVYQTLADGQSVVALQEANTSRKHQELISALGEVGLPYFYKGNQSLKLFSRYPIINKGIVVGEESSANGAIFVDVKIEERIVRVYNIHLKSTGVAEEADRVITRDPNTNRRETWQRVLYILRRLKYSNQTRAQQVKQLAAHIDASPYPVVLCGDLNDTPFSYAYQQLTYRLTDAFVVQGRGLSVTYKGPIPGLRIDYIFASADLQPVAYRVLRGQTSDHRPVVASFVWGTD